MFFSYLKCYNLILLDILNENICNMYAFFCTAQIMTRINMDSFVFSTCIKLIDEDKEPRYSFNVLNKILFKSVN